MKMRRDGGGKIRMRGREKMGGKEGSKLNRGRRGKQGEEGKEE